MYNKSMFSKSVKESKKNGRIFYDGYAVCNGYWIFRINEEIKEVLIKEFLTEEKFSCENGSITKGENARIMNLDNLIANSPREQRFKFTGYISKTNKGECYVLIGEDEKTKMWIDRKYYDILDIDNSFKLYGSTAINALNVYDRNDEFIAMIMPIRHEELEYSITKN